jgi:hypothetical protein
LSIDEEEEEEEEESRTPGQFGQHTQDNDTKLLGMLAAQAAHREEAPVIGDVDSIVDDPKLNRQEKTDILHKSLHMAASNGDVVRVKQIAGGRAKDLVNINAVDEEGTTPLIYASCFGHQEVVQALLDEHAIVDAQDRNQWTALMWAMTNGNKDIAKLLLDAGASQTVKSSSGRTAFDFAAPNSDMANYLLKSGYHIGDAGVVGDDFYNAGFSQDKFEQEMEENEMKRRMMMESSRNLEVDLSSLGMDERPEVSDRSR